MFCFKQKTADEVRFSDWSADVCSSDLTEDIGRTLSVCPMMAALATMVMGANCPWCRQAQRQAPDSQQSGSDVPSSVDTDTSAEVCRPVAACGDTSLVVFASASWHGILPSGVAWEVTCALRSHLPEWFRCPK